MCKIADVGIPEEGEVGQSEYGAILARIA